jgi:hypothetical protein
MNNLEHGVLFINRLRLLLLLLVVELGFVVVLWVLTLNFEQKNNEASGRDRLPYRLSYED